MDRLFQEAMKTQSDYVLAVPTMFEVCTQLAFKIIFSFIAKVWSRNEIYVNWMASRSGLVCHRSVSPFINSFLLSFMAGGP